MPALDLLTWDLDGTLYDQRAVRTEVRRRITRSVRPGIWRGARDAGRALRQHRLAERRVRGADGVVDPAARALWSGPLWSGFMEQFVLPALEAVGPWPGVSERLDAIARLGVRQVVVSDFPVDAKLDALGLSTKFECGFAGSELGALKPHPSVFAHVFAALGVEPAAVVHVGDRLDTDGRAADYAGVGFIHVVHGDFVPIDVLMRRRMQ